MGNFSGNWSIKVQPDVKGTPFLKQVTTLEIPSYSPGSSFDLTLLISHGGTDRPITIPVSGTVENDTRFSFTHEDQGGGHRYEGHFCMVASKMMGLVWRGPKRSEKDPDIGPDDDMGSFVGISKG
jgi:hypothetical protein